LADMPLFRLVSRRFEQNASMKELQKWVMWV